MAVWNSKKWNVALSLIVLAAIIGLGAWYATGHVDDFRRILDIDAMSFVELSILCTLAIWLSGVQMNAVTLIFGTRITQWEGFGLSAVNTMANFYFTKAGLAAKGIYLKRTHNFSYTQYLSALAGAYVVTIITQGLLGFLFYFWTTRGGNMRFEFLLIFAALVLGGVVPLVLPKMEIPFKGRFFQRVNRVISGWERVKRHRRLLVVVAVLNIAYSLVGGVRLFVSYQALGYEVALLPCMVMSPLSTITMVASLTPGAVGIRQALVGYGSQLLDIGMTQGIVASTIDHAVGTLWVFVFGLIFMAWAWHRSRGRNDLDGEGL